MSVLVAVAYPYVIGGGGRNRTAVQQILEYGATSVSL
jgi:imidazole glycerol phosphate synthase subunit HisF